MMGSNDNFLLKIHMEEDTLTEIFLNKERHSFTFVNDECVQDLIIPEFKMTSLNMILENVSDNEKNDKYYAEYDRNGETVREYDHDKIALIRDMVTSISISDFLEYLKSININEYYVDTIVDAYNCVLPNDVKKIVSYTTNGVDFSDSEKMRMMSHDDIVKYKGPIKNFVPLIIKNDTNYIGYDYKDGSYKEYEKESVINEADTLKELFAPVEVEAKKEEIKEEAVVDDANEEDIELIDEELQEKIEEVFENNDMFESENEEVEEQKDSEESSVEEKEEVVEPEPIVEENDIEYDDKIKNIDYQFEKLNAGIVQKPEKKEQEIKDLVVKEEHQEEPKDEEKEKIEEEKKREEKANIKREIIAGVRKSLQEIEETNAIIDEIDDNIEKTKKDEKEDTPKLSDLVNESLINACENYKINFNDTQKLVVEHLPYYEFSSSFDVIQIPEIDLDKLTLLPHAEIDLGKLKLEVESLSNSHVDLVVKSATSIVDKDDNKLKRGSHITLDLKSETTLRLNKKGAMETWSLRMERSTFEKELRNIDYSKIMNIISELDSFKKLGNIEKFELHKSIMLFIHFVMLYKEDKKLDELYRVLEEEPTLYEEYVTKYNIKHAAEMKNELHSYDYKKEYVTKLNYINGLIDAKWLDYPRYIFRTHKYFDSDDFLEEFIFDLEELLKERDFSDYLSKMFKEYKMFIGLDDEGKENLNKCLEYLSVLYKYNPSLGESIKYKIEKEFMIGAEEEDIALLISKLCRRGIKDYAAFVEYDAMMKESYRLGELKYPIFSESFGIEDIRNGGEYDEY